MQAKAPARMTAAGQPALIVPLDENPESGEKFP